MNFRALQSCEVFIFVFSVDEFVFALCRRQTGGEALPEIQGDEEKVRKRRLCLLQLQRAPVVSFSRFVYVHSTVELWSKCLCPSLYVRECLGCIVEIMLLAF